nr:unnamed protein product [Spirometra erinaceieuropaei]
MFYAAWRSSPPTDQPAGGKNAIEQDYNHDSWDHAPALVCSTLRLSPGIPILNARNLACLLAVDSSLYEFDDSRVSVPYRGCRGCGYVSVLAGLPIVRRRSDQSLLTMLSSSGTRRRARVPRRSCHFESAPPPRELAVGHT